MRTLRNIVIGLVSIFVIALPLVFATPDRASASVYVRGYYSSRGTYVAPHYRSNPDSSRYNNWSMRGNYNPYTGRIGTRRW